MKGTENDYRVGCQNSTTQDYIQLDDLTPLEVNNFLNFPGGVTLTQTWTTSPPSTLTFVNFMKELNKGTLKRQVGICTVSWLFRKVHSRALKNWKFQVNEYNKWRKRKISVIAVWRRRIVKVTPVMNRWSLS